MRPCCTTMKADDEGKRPFTLAQQNVGVAPMPQKVNGVVALPAVPVDPGQAQQFQFQPQGNANAPVTAENMVSLLETILDEQAILAGGIRQLYEAFSIRFDAIDKAVEVPSSVANACVDGMEELLQEEAAAEADDLEVEASKWFLQVDKDKSGTLSKDELKALLTSWSMSTKQTFKETLKLNCPADIDRLCDAADADGSGDIDKDEFVELVRLRKAECKRPAGSKDSPHLPMTQMLAKDAPPSIVEIIVTNVKFEIFITCAIVLNLCTMTAGLQLKGLDYGSKIGLRPKDGIWAEHESRLHFFELCFNAIYTAELLMRIYVHILKRRIRNSEILDAVIVLMSAVDVFLLQPLQVQFPNVAVLRIARLAKLQRFFRILRFSEHLSEVRVLLHTLRVAVRGIVWSVLMLASIISAGAIVMTQLIGPSLEDESIPLDRRQWIYMHFGTTTSSMHTMFESTFTGGWRFFSRPIIEEVHYFFALFWVLWVLLVNFVTMRVVGALFLSQTLKVARQDHEKCAMAQLRQKGALCEDLRMIFRNADTSGDGSMSQDEFDEMMSHSQVKDQFEQMGLDVDEVSTFFSVLIADDGLADYNEFVNGALAMATSAPAIDMMKQLQYDIKIEQRLQKILDGVEAIPKMLAGRTKTGVNAGKAKSA